MADWLQQIIAWVGAHPHWTGFAVFLVALAESLAVVGILVPGVVMMFAAGALIGAGAVGFWPLYWLAVLGAVLGDGLSFWLGHHFRDRVGGFWPFSRHPDKLQVGVDFFARYGGKSVAFGRFFGPVRAVIPLVAGMLSMPPWRFFVANLLSALVWAGAYLAPGIVFGASLELASEVAFRLVLLVLLVVVGLWLIGWLGHRIFFRFQPAASRIVQWLLDWGERSAWTGRMASALADPAHPEARGLAAFAGLLVVATALFSVTLTLTLEGTPLAGVDQAVNGALASLRTPAADAVMVFITAIGDGWWMGGVALCVFVVLLFSARRAAWYWLAAVAFAFVVPGLLKYLVQVPRPHVVEGMFPWGFPSAHALRVTVLFGFLAVMVGSELRAGLRWPLYWAALLLAVLVGFSRLYLGVHWLSDVAGGVLLGVLWIAALGIAYRHHPHGYPPPMPIVIALVLVGVSGALFQASERQSTEVARYAPPREIRDAASKDWLSGRLSLPSERDDLTASMSQPLNIQYAGDPAWLATVLAKDGWQPAERLGWGNALRLLSSSLPLAELPVLPQVHDGRHERLILVKDLSDGNRLTLRLWPTDIRLMPGELPLWLGNLGLIERRMLLDFVAYPSASIPPTGPEALRDELRALAKHSEKPPSPSDGLLRILGSDTGM